jgi:hypothetical protein
MVVLLERLICWRVGDCLAGHKTIFLVMLSQSLIFEYNRLWEPVLIEAVNNVIRGCRHPPLGMT